MIQLTPQMRILVAVEPFDFRKGTTDWKESAAKKYSRIPFRAVSLSFATKRKQPLRL